MNELQWLAIGLGVAGSLLSVLCMWSCCILASDCDDAMEADYERRQQGIPTSVEPLG